MTSSYFDDEPKNLKVFNNEQNITTDLLKLFSFVYYNKIPLLKNNKTKCFVKVVAYDDSKKKLGSDKSDGPFTIEALTITNPVNNSTCASGQPLRNFGIMLILKDLYGRSMNFSGKMKD